jgi:hypothetical protein
MRAVIHTALIASSIFSQVKKNEQPPGVNGNPDFS